MGESKREEGESGKKEGKKRGKGEEKWQIEAGQ